MHENTQKIKSELLSKHFGKIQLQKFFLSVKQYISRNIIFSWISYKRQNLGKLTNFEVLQIEIEQKLRQFNKTEKFINLHSFFY